MATAAVPAKESERECSICNDLFTEPKLLLCGHLLCEKCLQSWAESKKNAECPLCRRTIVDAQKHGGKTLKEVLKTFPTDFGMKTLVDAERLLRNNLECCVCEDVAATNICLTCRDKFCQACTKVHKKSSVSKHHAVETLVSVTAETLAANKSSVCSNHTDRPADVVCISHNVAVCLCCARTGHRKCKEIVNVEDKIGEERAQLQELAATLNQGESDFGKAMNDLGDKETRWHNSANIFEVMQVYTRLLQLTKTYSERLEKLRLNILSDDKKSIAKVRKKLINLKGKLTTHKQAAARAEFIQEYSDLRQMTSTMKERVEDLDPTATLPTYGDLNPFKVVVFDEEMASTVEKDLEQLFQSIKIVTESPFPFHSSHGKDVVLSSIGQVAEKKGKSEYDGLVFSRQPMENNYVYEVRVTRLSPGQGSNPTLIWPGMATTSPDSDSLDVPYHAWRWTSATVVNMDKACDRGRVIQSSVGRQLANIQAGSRVGVSVDDNRMLWVHRDGMNAGVVSSARPIPEPAYALFDVWGAHCTIEALPLRLFKI